MAYIGRSLSIVLVLVITVHRSSSRREPEGNVENPNLEYMTVGALAGSRALNGTAGSKVQMHVGPRVLNAKSRDTEAAREEIPKVPGAFLLHDVLTAAECKDIISASERMGFNMAAPSIEVGSTKNRKNQDVVWIPHETMANELFERIRPHLPTGLGKPIGMNQWWIIYKYGPGDHFPWHYDDAGNGISYNSDTGTLNLADPGKYTHLSSLLYLNDDFDGGHTELSTADGGVHSVVPSRGSALVFFQEPDQLQALHQSPPVMQGYKYSLRTDVIYSPGDWRYSNGTLWSEQA